MDNKQDKLDDFLRDQLNDSSENPSWNVPGDHVFENAINALPKKKKNNRRVWILLPILFLAVFFGREYFHMNEINQLENKITDLEETITTQSLSETNIKDAPIRNNAEIIRAEETAADKEIAENEFSTQKIIATEQTEEFENKNTSNTQNETVTRAEQTSSEARTIHNRNIASSTGDFNANNTNVSASNATVSLENPSSKSMEDTANNETLLSNSSRQNQNTSLVDSAQTWSTSMLTALPISHLDTWEVIPEIGLPNYVLMQTAPTSAHSYPWRYGVLAGGNQSSLTMKNIPENPEGNLYAYENCQPGAGVYAFIEKPLSKKISLQAGLGYQYYQNQSILEDQFLFDEDNVIMTSGGEEIYQTPLNVINPLGDYNTMLTFRVSDEMEQNDIIQEYTMMKQKLHTVHLDLSLGYKVISIDRFDISLGAGLGLGYLAGLKNDFNISCYHNGQLQGNRTESPKNLSDSQKWYGQAIGKINVVYHLNSNTGLILESQYRSGITSLRRGTEVNGSQTYIHALGLSVGLSHSF